MPQVAAAAEEDVPVSRSAALAYVNHADAEAFEALGWRSTGAFEGCHHGYYADLWEWIGEGEPRYPAKEQDNEAERDSA
jgi:hypothetical protein